MLCVWWSQITHTYSLLPHLKDSVGNEAELFSLVGALDPIPIRKQNKSESGTWIPKDKITKKSTFWFAHSTYRTINTQWNHHLNNIIQCIAYCYYQPRIFVCVLVKWFKKSFNNTTWMMRLQPWSIELLHFNVASPDMGNINITFQNQCPDSLMQNYHKVQWDMHIRSQYNNQKTARILNTYILVSENVSFVCSKV